MEKLSHLHYFLHDIVSGPNPTAVRVAEAASTNSSSTLFGCIAMIDDPLTVVPNPDPNSWERPKEYTAQQPKQKRNLHHHAREMNLRKPNQ
ncbi:hypothetical protein ACSQ67_001323 [Phaseolus vulgaris]